MSTPKKKLDLESLEFSKLVADIDARWGHTYLDCPEQEDTPPDEIEPVKVYILVDE